MSDRDPPVVATARLVKALSHRHFEATLPNSAPVVAHIRRRDSEAIGPLEPGDSVHVELTPFDFSHARIVDRVHAEASTAPKTKKAGKNLPIHHDIPCKSADDVT